MNILIKNAKGENVGAIQRLLFNKPKGGEIHRARFSIQRLGPQYTIVPPAAFKEMQFNIAFEKDGEETPFAMNVKFTGITATYQSTDFLIVDFAEWEAAEIFDNCGIV